MSNITYMYTKHKQKYVLYSSITELILFFVGVKVADKLVAV